MGRSTFARLRRRLASDAGFSLIEAVVALVILALVSTSFTYGMNLALRVTRDDRLRQQATHLAERELEIVRNKFQHADETGQLGVLAAGRVLNDAPLPGGTRGSPLEVDGREFTVERTNSIQLSGNGESTCDGGGSVGYLTMAVSVSVSWSDAGQTHAVESKTLLTPVKGVEGAVGYIAAKLTNALGAGTGNVPVVATGPSGSLTRYTADDGCAVFMIATPGSYTLRLDSTGYVNQDGIQQVEKSVALELGKLQVVTFAYDRAAGISVSYRTAIGHVLPTPLPGVTVYNSSMVDQGGRHQPGGTNPMSVVGLWPSGGYAVWAGTCDQSDPGVRGVRPAGVPVAAGETATATVDLAPIAVRTVSSTLFSPVDGVTLIARPADSPGCEGGELELTLGVTSGGGILNTSLPAGSWLVEPSGVACVEIPDISTCPEVTPTLVVVDEFGAELDLLDPAMVVTLPEMSVNIP